MIVGLLSWSWSRVRPWPSGSSEAHSRSMRPCPLRCRLPRRWKSRTRRESSTETSSQPTSRSPPTARSKCSTSDWPRRWRATPQAPVLQPAMTQSPTLTAQMTGAGVLLGTAAYMSPEQARGQTADKRADIWAFGVVLMEMLIGKLVYGGDTVSDTLAGVLAREPEWEELPKDTPQGRAKPARSVSE